MLVTVRPAFRSSAAVAVRSVRSCARMRSRCRRRSARWRFAHALSAKAKDGGLIVIDIATLEAAKTKALIGHFSGLGLTNALIIDGAELHAGFAVRCAQHSEHRRAADPGHQRL